MPLSFSSQHAELAACARAEARTEALTLTLTLTLA